MINPVSPSTALRYASASGRWVIAATVLGSGVAALDGTVVGIALPAIGRDFHADVAGLQWVVTSYLLTLAGLILLGGRLGDLFGRRRIFVIGVVWFALASALCALAPSIAVLIAARALLGVGGALLTPASLAILEASFAPQDRGRAIGAWSGLGGLATAIGPFVGGPLISALSWRLVFVVNVPLAVAVVLIALRHVPETRSETSPPGLDGLGAALATIGLVGLSFGLIEAPEQGWTSPLVLASLALGAASLVALPIAEARVPHPMLALGIFRSRQFSAANVMTFIVYAALSGCVFLVPVQLQLVAHYTPLEAGAAMLPATAIMFALSSRSADLASRIGPRFQMTAGPLVIGAGMLLLARAGAGGYVTNVLPAMIVFGVGLTLTVAPLTTAVLAAAPVEDAGMASAVNNAVARAAGLLAVAILPAAAGITGSVYLHPAQLDAGFRVAMVIAAAACAAGGLVSALTISGRLLPVGLRRPSPTIARPALDPSATRS